MPLNILITDDSIIARSVILKTLRSTGLELGEIHQAANGQEALEILENNWVDLMFLDINMPVMNGEEVIERIRGNPLWAELPIIIVSTEGSVTRVEHLMSLGARFVHKPYTPEAIRNTVLETVKGVTHER